MQVPFSQRLYVPALFLLLGCATSNADQTIVIQTGQKVAFLGDSITAKGWGYPGGYVRLVVDGLAKEGIKIVPLPAAVGGNTSKDMLARIGRDVLNQHPDWMTLSCGVNDVWHGAQGVDLATYQKNITSMVDQATAAGVKVVIFTATPISEENNANNQKLTAYNDFLRQLAKERNLPLADMSADFQAALQKVPTSPASRNLTVDGVHMNPEGNVLMAKGCLRAFGISQAETDKIELEWGSQPATAMILGGNIEAMLGANVSAQPLGITLAQFREIEKTAQARNTDFERLGATLWLQALGEILQPHALDSSILPDEIQKETEARFLLKIDALSKTPASPTGT